MRAGRIGYAAQVGVIHEQGDQSVTDDVQATRDQGIEAFRQGRVDDAIRLLSQAVSDDPRDHRAYAVLGAAHVQRKEYEQAIAAFENARTIRPDAAHIHYNLGLAYQRAGRADDAVPAFQAALEVDPTYEKAKDALNRAQAAARPPGQPSGPPLAPPAPDEASPGPARMPTVPPAAEAAPSPPAAGQDDSPTEEKTPSAPEPEPPTPADARPGPPKMPSVPPAAPAASGPPKAPWDTDSSTGPAKPADDTFQLRRLGGGQEPAKPAPGQKQASGEAASGGPPRAPWEMEGNQVQRLQRPVDRRPKEAPPPRRPEATQTRRPGYVPPRTKKPTQSQYAAAGALGGAIYGAIFMVVLVVVDRILGSQWGVLAKAGKPGLIPLIIGAAITGALFGAIIGVPTAVSANTAPGIYTGVGLWVFVAIIIHLRAGTTGLPLLLGLGVGAVYGLLMGWIVASQTNSSIKRE
ncbi:MAG: tetratricopeptide repeat protein [Armatimonadota bacterium]|nr:MAG: tetratricopeptide repeat protein [Armatimonadota bacterium]